MTPAVTDASGAWVSAPIPISSTPALQGTALVLQGIVGPTATPPLGFDFTNGVRLTFGL